MAIIGKNSEASKILKRASELELSGKIKEAIAEIEKAIHINPGDGSLYNRLGDLYVKRKKVKEAVDSYKKGVKAFRRESFFRNALGLCKKILRYDPGTTETYLMIAELLVELDEKSDALIYFFEYIEKQRAKKNTEEILMTLEDIRRLGIRDKKTVDKIRAIYKAIGRPELFQELTEPMGGEEEKITLEEVRSSEIVTPFADSSETKTGEDKRIPARAHDELIDNRSKDVESALADLRKAGRLDEVVAALDKSMTALSGEHKKAIALLQKSVSLNLDTFRKTIHEFHQASEKNTKTLAQLLTNLSTALASLSKSQTSLADEMNARLEKMGNSFNTATRDVAKEIKILSVNHQNAVDETKEYNKSILNISQELKKGIQKINDSLTKFVLSQEIREKNQRRYTFIIIGIIAAMCAMLFISVLK